MGSYSSQMVFKAVETVVVGLRVGRRVVVWLLLLLLLLASRRTGESFR